VRDLVAVLEYLDVVSPAGLALPGHGVSPADESRRT
jgi:hypothetical protein